jgi:serine/threonine protein phosphatase 1
MRRHIIIGDIHGCLGELEQLLAVVGATPEDVIVSVGDLVDRGPESPAVVRFFREHPNTLAIAGNHERKHIRGIFSYAQEITRLQFGSAYDDAVAWMRTLPYALELDDAIVVHAGLVPGLPLASQQPEILCGSTSGEKELEGLMAGVYWHERWTGPKPVVFGHHVVDEPLVRSGLVYGIDTGACHGGQLTALTIPDFHLHSVPAREDHWARIKRAWQADVLASKPWEAMSWQELDEQLARFRNVDEPRSRAYVGALLVWRDRVDARLDEVLAAVQGEAARLTAEGGEHGRAVLAKSHSLSTLLFQSFRGRLDRAALSRQVYGPRRLDEICITLGLDAAPLPALPKRASS